MTLQVVQGLRGTFRAVLFPCKWLKLSVPLRPSNTYILIAPMLLAIPIASKPIGPHPTVKEWYKKVKFSQQFHHHKSELVINSQKVFFKCYIKFNEFPGPPHPTPDHISLCSYPTPLSLYRLLVENKIYTLNKYSIPSRVDFFHSLMCDTKC